jgi:hypothetical protein
MCGATTEQKGLEIEQADFYKQAILESNAVFGQQQELQKQIEGIFMPILRAGPNQMGFSDDELNLLKAQAVEGTATNYAKASKVLSENLAARGGGTSPLTTGGQAQLEGELAQGSAAEQSKEETGILTAGYQQGYQEFSDAFKAIDAVSNQLSPTSYLTGATGAGTAASNTADQIAQEQNSWVNAAIGAAGAIGGGLLGNPNVFGKPG